MSRSDEPRKGRRRRPSARVLHGLGAAPGIAIGRALILDRGSAQIFEAPVAENEVEVEVGRLEAAVEATRAQLREIREQLAENSGEEYAFIFDAHLLFLDDDHLVGDALRSIREKRHNAEWALDQACRNVEELFSGIGDPILRERAADVADVHERIQRNLSGSEHHDLSELTEDVVVVAHSLPPSEAASLHFPHVVGFLTEVGGRTSHTAIVAKSLGIPAAVGVEGALKHVRQGSLIALDGFKGEVLLSPNEAAVKRYANRRQAYFSQERELIANREQPAVTTDGVGVSLRANVELVEELPSASEHGAEGIGLYRSEFLFLRKSPKLPSLDDHFQTYRCLLQAADPHPVTIRTLDLGGEKYFHDVLQPGEANPDLGLRGVRFALVRPDIVKTQVEGVLRAAAEGGKARLMVPLISAIEEVRLVKKLLEEVRSEIGGSVADVEVPFGIMVEVPSAALLADQLASEVDFFAIGTNDLIQYTMAVDRGNEHVSHLFQPLNPAVLRLIEHTANAACSAGITVSVCGEMAASPLHAPLLVGLGINELSMDPVSVPLVKEAVRAHSAAELSTLAEECLQLSDAAEIEGLLEERVGPRIKGLRGDQLRSRGR
ncbi:MAG: phosphoenolpyruvate--protein phosphotransferase [Acidobacteriota bacterium]